MAKPKKQSSMDQFLERQAAGEPALRAEFPVAEVPDRPQSDSPQPSPAAADVVLIELPVADVPIVTWGLHINAHLTPDQSLALRRLTQALDSKQISLANGERVTKPTHALKWVLETLAAAQ